MIKLYDGLHFTQLGYKKLLRSFVLGRRHFWTDVEVLVASEACIRSMAVDGLRNKRNTFGLDWHGANAERP